MPIIREKKNRFYTCMANYHLCEKHMSLKAKGLMSVILSLPDTWAYSVRGLATLSSDGEDSVRSALAELEHHHYLVMERVRDEKGTLRGTNYTLYEKPQVPEQDMPTQALPKKVAPAQGKPAQENPKQENLTQLSTKAGSTHEGNKNHVMTYQGSTKGIKNTQGLSGRMEGFSPDVREAFQDFMKMRAKMNSPVTPRAAELILKRLVEYAGQNDAQQLSLLNEAIEHGWKTVYPARQPSPCGAGGSAPGKSSVQSFAAQTIAIMKQKGMIE